jgi:ribosomal-protein-alanine N-acetyltransferase
MPVTLVQLELSQLEALRTDPTRLNTIPIVSGALPPQFILDAAGFKGAPINGRVEIGYGVAGEYRGRGVATEAITKLARVAFCQPSVEEVFAETATENEPSQRVVAKVGFRHTGQRDAGEDGVVYQWLLVR